MSIMELKALVAFILDSLENGVQPSTVLKNVVKYLVAVICSQE